VQLTARLVDAPCNEMNTEAFTAEAVAVAEALGITPTIIKGEELRERGFGGLYGVGKVIFSSLTSSPSPSYFFFYFSPSSSSSPSSTPRRQCTRLPW
jgi:hypothetical protein